MRIWITLFLFILSVLAQEFSKMKSTKTDCSQNYHKEIVGNDTILVINDTHDYSWIDYPEVKVRVDFGIGDSLKIFYLNYKEYWYEFLLCDPHPSRKLHIISRKKAFDSTKIEK